jgi:hypothetical protein
MLSAQVFIMTAYVQARKRIKGRLHEMAHDDRGEFYAQVAWAVMCIAAAITIVTVLYIKWHTAANNSPTTGPGAPALGPGGAPITSPTGG